MGTVMVSKPFLVNSSTKEATGATTKAKSREKYHGIPDMKSKVNKVTIKEVMVMATLPSMDLTPSMWRPDNLCRPAFFPTMAATASPGPQAIMPATTMYR